MRNKHVFSGRVEKPVPFWHQKRAWGSWEVFICPPYFFFRALNDAGRRVLVIHTITQLETVVESGEALSLEELTEIENFILRSKKPLD